MKASLALLGLLSYVSYVEGSVNKWTPEDFDWTGVKTYPGILKQNLTETSVPSKGLVLYAANNYNMTETDLVSPKVEILGIALSLGFSLRTALTVGLQASAIAGTINGCIGAVQDPTFRNAFFCGLGVVSTIAGIGLAASAKKAIPAADIALEEIASDTWDSSGLLSLAENYFTKRGLGGGGFSKREAVAQMLHDDRMLNAVRSTGMKDVEHLGYEDAYHPFSKRDGSHPLASRFRFTHPKGGRMVASTRDVAGSTHITLEPWYEEHEHEIRKRDNSYREERFQDGNIMEGRFDYEATQADTNSISTDETGEEAFSAVESGLECFVGEQGMTSWPGYSTIDVQFYDSTNEETFGYGSMGIFGSDDTSGVDSVQPDPPLTGGQSC